MANPPAVSDWLTESDIDHLVADGEVELEDPGADGTPLLQLTRRIAQQYVSRFSDWSESADPDVVPLARQALADVDRLAQSSGDAAMREVLASVPEGPPPPAPGPRHEAPAGAETRRWFTTVRGWVGQFAALFGGSAPVSRPPSG